MLTAGAVEMAGAARINGVSPVLAMVTASRPAYEAESTLTPFAGIQAEYAFSESTHLIGGAGISWLGEGIGDSPIVDERNVGGGYVGLVYRF